MSVQSSSLPLTKAILEFRDKSPAEIIAIFEGYGFVDRHGHPLANCIDFRALVAMASASKE